MAAAQADALSLPAAPLDSWSLRANSAPYLWHHKRQGPLLAAHSKIARHARTVAMCHLVSRGAPLSLRMDLSSSNGVSSGSDGAGSTVLRRHPAGQPQSSSRPAHTFAGLPGTPHGRLRSPLVAPAARGDRERPVPLQLRDGPWGALACPPRRHAASQTPLAPERQNQEHCLSVDRRGPRTR
eukprot:scaffold51_cov401-Prasinococcus_capsulatus_cf.AAC.43